MSALLNILLLILLASGASATCVHVQNDDMLEYSCSGGYSLDLESIPSNAEKIQIFEMPIRVITSNTFARFGENLWVLICSHCSIVDIDSDAFSRLVNLQQLILNNNHLRIIKARWFENLNSMTYLDLNYNNIDTIEEGVFKNLPSLVELRISGNRLQCLNLEDMSHLMELKRTYLSENPDFRCPNAVNQFLEDRKVSFERDPMWDRIPQDMIHVRIPAVDETRYLYTTLPSFRERLHLPPTIRPDDPKEMTPRITTPPLYPPTHISEYTTMRARPSISDYPERTHLTIPEEEKLEEEEEEEDGGNEKVEKVEGELYEYDYEYSIPFLPTHRTEYQPPSAVIPVHHPESEATQIPATEKSMDSHASPTHRIEHQPSSAVVPVHYTESATSQIPATEKSMDSHASPTHRTEHQPSSVAIPIHYPAESETTPFAIAEKPLVIYAPPIPGPTEIIYPLEHMTPDFKSPSYEDPTQPYVPYSPYSTSTISENPSIIVPARPFTTESETSSNSQAHPARENENEYYGQPSYSEATRPPLLAPSHDDRHETFVEADVARSTEPPRIYWTPNTDDSKMDHNVENRLVDPLVQSSNSDRDAHVIRPVPILPETMQPASPDVLFQAPFEPTVTTRPPPENYRSNGESTTVIPIGAITTDKPFPECPQRSSGEKSEAPFDVLAATMIIVVLKYVLVEGF